SVRHVGLTESMAMIADALGWSLDRITDEIQPKLASVTISSEFLAVDPGYVCGIIQDGVGYRKNEPVIKLHMEAYLGSPETYDSVEIEGSPKLSMKVSGGIHGDVATASIAVNSIPKVLDTAPGLHTMRDLALPSFFPGRYSERERNPDPRPSRRQDLLHVIRGRDVLPLLPVEDRGGVEHVEDVERERRALAVDRQLLFHAQIELIEVLEPCVAPAVEVDVGLAQTARAVRRLHDAVVRIALTQVQEAGDPDLVPREHVQTRHLAEPARVRGARLRAIQLRDVGRILIADVRSGVPQDRALDVCARVHEPSPVQSLARRQFERVVLARPQRVL